ncbi:uncharacterized protein LOC144434569 [Glandiceps talaboti]
MPQLLREKIPEKSKAEYVMVVEQCLCAVKNDNITELQQVYDPKKLLKLRFPKTEGGRPYEFCTQGEEDPAGDTKANQNCIHNGEKAALPYNTLIQSEQCSSDIQQGATPGAVCNFKEETIVNTLKETNRSEIALPESNEELERMQHIAEDENVEDVEQIRNKVTEEQEAEDEKTNTSEQPSWSSTSKIPSSPEQQDNSRGVSKKESLQDKAKSLKKVVDGAIDDLSEEGSETSLNEIPHGVSPGPVHFNAPSGDTNGQGVLREDEKLSASLPSHREVKSRPDHMDAVSSSTHIDDKDETYHNQPEPRMFESQAEVSESKRSDPAVTSLHNSSDRETFQKPFQRNGDLSSGGAIRKPTKRESDTTPKVTRRPDITLDASSNERFWRQNGSNRRTQRLRRSREHYNLCAMYREDNTGKLVRKPLIDSQQDDVPSRQTIQSMVMYPYSSRASHQDDGDEDPGSPGYSDSDIEMISETSDESDEGMMDNQHDLRLEDLCTELPDCAGKSERQSQRAPGCTHIYVYCCSGKLRYVQSTATNTYRDLRQFIYDEEYASRGYQLEQLKIFHSATLQAVNLDAMIGLEDQSVYII